MLLISPLCIRAAFFSYSSAHTATVVQTTSFMRVQDEMELRGDAKLRTSVPRNPVHADPNLYSNSEYYA